MLLRNAPLTLKMFTLCLSEPLLDNNLVLDTRFAGSDHDLRSKDWCMLMDAQSPHGVLGCRNGSQGIIHTHVPKFDLAIATSTNKLSQASPLHMHVGDPLLMLAPHLDHCLSWSETLIEHTNGAVTIATHKNEACYLV